MGKVVTGTFRTPMGVCRFHINHGMKATIFLGADRDHGLIVHRVEYRGQIGVHRKDADSPWEERGGHTVFNRADGKDINYKNNTYGDIKNAILAAWSRYSTTPGLMTAAVHAQLENEREEYVRELHRAEERLREASNAFASFDSQKGPMRRALQMGVENLGDMEELSFKLEDQ